MAIGYTALGMYNSFRPKMFGSKLLLIDLEAEMANKGQARCQ